jgi:hypothetical protein
VIRQTPAVRSSRARRTLSTLPARRKISPSTGAGHRRRHLPTKQSSASANSSLRLRRRFRIRTYHSLSSTPRLPTQTFPTTHVACARLQFIDNATVVRGSHTLKGGINFRFNRHRDDRSNVAGSAIEPVVTFSGTAGFAGFNLPASGATSINNNDLTRLQNTIVDELGRIGTVSQAFVLDPNNPSVPLLRPERDG